MYIQHGIIEKNNKIGGGVILKKFFHLIIIGGQSNVGLTKRRVLFCPE